MKTLTKHRNPEAARAVLRVILAAKPKAYEPTPELAEFWTRTLDPDMPADTAETIALEAFRDGKEWLQPGDINIPWRALKRERLERCFTTPTPPPWIAENPAAYAVFMHEWTRQISQGEQLVTAREKALKAADPMRQIGR